MAKTPFIFILGLSLLGCRGFSPAKTDANNSSSAPTPIPTLRPAPSPSAAPTPSPTPAPTPFPRISSLVILSQPDAITRSATATFTFQGATVDGSPLSYKCRRNGDPFVSCQSPITYTGIGGGNKTFDVTATDVDGFETTARAAWIVDQIGPAVTLSATPQNSSDTSATFQFSATDQSGIDRFECQLDSGGFSPCASPKTYANLAVGAHTFFVRATDGAGNLGATTNYGWTVAAPPATPVPATPPPDLVLDGPTKTLSAAAASNYRGFDGAYDPADKMFLVIYGNGPVGGLFLDDSGNQVGAGFSIARADIWSQLPRVAYASRDNVFLVTWHREENGPKVYGRLLRAGANGVPQFLGPEFYIGGSATFQEGAPSVAYSSVANEFLVTWTQNGIFAQRVSTSGQLLGSMITIANDGDWAEQSNVAYHPASNSFFVITMRAHGNTSYVSLSRIQSGTGALLGAATTVENNLVFAKITDAEYNSTTGQILLAWYYVNGGGGGFHAQHFDGDGRALGTPVTIFAPFSSYDGFDVSYNPSTNTYFSVFHGTNEAFGGEFDPGFQQSAPFQVTNSGSRNGTFVPRLVAHPTKKFWLVISTADYGRLIIQKISHR